MLNVKNAEIADLEQIMKIYRYAQDYMIKSGNPTQWGHFYPDADLIKSDIDKNACKVIYDKDGIHGVFSVFDGTEPTYKPSTISQSFDMLFLLFHFLHISYRIL